MSQVMLTKDKVASTKNSEGINMQEGPPKGDLEVRKGTPKVEPDGPNTGVATTILKVGPREPKVEPEDKHALKAPLRNYPGGSRVRRTTHRTS